MKMAQEEAQVRCQATPCGVFGVQSDSGKCFSPSFSVLCYRYQYHSSIDSYSFIHISPTLQQSTASLNNTKTKKGQLLKYFVLYLIHISHSVHRPEKCWYTCNQCNSHKHTQNVHNSTLVWLQCVNIHKMGLNYYKSQINNHVALSYWMQSIVIGHTNSLLRTFSSRWCCVQHPNRTTDGAVCNTRTEQPMVLYATTEQNNRWCCVQHPNRTPDGAVCNNRTGQPVYCPAPTFTI